MNRNFFNTTNNFTFLPRSDEYEAAVNSLVQFGGALVSVGGSNLLDLLKAEPQQDQRQEAGEGEELVSQEELLHRIQVGNGFFCTIRIDNQNDNNG